MKTYLKVKDYPGLVRDPVSKAIISVDQQARKNYINQKTIAEVSASSINEVKQEVGELKNELSEIKSMLTLLLSDKK